MRLIRGHSLENVAAASVVFRNTPEMIFEMCLDLALGLLDKAHAVPVACQAGERTDDIAACKPQWSESARCAIELRDSLRAPGQMVAFFGSGAQQVLECFRRAGKQRLSVIQGLSSDLTGMVDAQQRNAALPLLRGELRIGGRIDRGGYRRIRTRRREACAQTFGRAIQGRIDQAAATAHTRNYSGCKFMPPSISLRAWISGSASIVKFVRAATAAAFVTVFVAAGSALAQEEEDDDDPFEGAASLGYLSTSGNTDSENVNAAFSLKWQPSRWSHEFSVSAVRAETSGVTTADAQFANYAARRDFGEKSYLIAALDWQSDEFSAYDSQMSETVGYGRHLVATERHSLDVEIGAGARQAKLRTGMEQDESIGRAALEYAWDFSETAQFAQGLVIESGSSNTRTETLSELRADLIGNLALVVSYRVRHNSDVPVGTEKSDRFTAISLEYGF